MRQERGRESTALISCFFILDGRLGDRPGGFWWEARLVIVTHRHLQFGMGHTGGRAVARRQTGRDLSGLVLVIVLLRIATPSCTGVMAGVETIDVGEGSQRTPPSFLPTVSFGLGDGRHCQSCSRVC